MAAGTVDGASSFRSELRREGVVVDPEAPLRMPSRREAMQFCIVSLLEGKLPCIFAFSVGEDPSREQCRAERQKYVCPFC